MRRFNFIAIVLIGLCSLLTFGIPILDDNNK